MSSGHIIIFYLINIRVIRLLGLRQICAWYGLNAQVRVIEYPTNMVMQEERTTFRLMYRNCGPDGLPNLRGFSIFLRYWSQTCFLNFPHLTHRQLNKYTKHKGCVDKGKWLISLREDTAWKTSAGRKWTASDFFCKNFLILQLLRGESWKRVGVGRGGGGGQPGGQKTHTKHKITRNFGHS